MTVRDPIPPRLYCLLASDAPCALVFRRGPSTWFHLMRWDLDRGTVEPGAWVKKKLFPRRCDLSADGKLMLYFLSGSFEGKYRVFGGVSRVPWLHPLASWDERDTYGRGSHFASGHVAFAYGEPFEMDLKTARVKIRLNENTSFINERRRGWVEARDCPPRASTDVWDEMRSVILEKPNPSGPETLRLDGGFYQPSGGVDGKAPRYALASGTVSGPKDFAPMTDAVWADWDNRGRLLTATNRGFLRIEQIESGVRSVVSEIDVSNLKPDPGSAPPTARVAS